MTLVAIFAYGPSALLITIGVLILVFGHATKDVVFGVMTLSLTVTLLGGVALTIVYVRRESSVAQLQTEFVNKVSHDLRTPLTSIRLFVETLQAKRLQDPEKIQQALTNLLSNAFKYSPEGAPVALHAWQQGDRLCLAVDDAGPGIPPEEAELVFDKYRRGRGAEGKPGAGLGLALVRRIAQLHGGRVWLEARQPQGSRFVIELPFNPGSAHRPD